jgi:hypothetical protein
MKKSINDFQVEKLENRKEFIFYCLLHLLCCTCGTNGGGTTTPPTNPNP